MLNMNITLQLSSAALPHEELDALTRQLAQTISSETAITAQIPEHQPTAGAKGDLITVGVLALSFLSTGAAVALIEVFKTYLGRVSNLAIEVKRPDGSQVSISAQNMKPEQMQDTVTRSSSLLEK
jgi:hypothetical protein